MDEERVEHMVAGGEESLCGCLRCLVAHLREGETETAVAIPVYMLQRRADLPEPPVVFSRVAPFPVRSVLVLVGDEPVHELPHVVNLPVVEDDVPGRDEHLLIAALPVVARPPCVGKVVVGGLGRGFHHAHRILVVGHTALDVRYDVVGLLVGRVRPQAHLGVVRPGDILGTERVRLFRGADEDMPFQYLPVVLVPYCVFVSRAVGRHQPQLRPVGKAQVPRGIVLDAPFEHGKDGLGRGRHMGRNRECVELVPLEQEPALVEEAEGGAAPLTGLQYDERYR